LAFGAFGSGYQRYLSERSVLNLLELAETSAFHRDVLTRHLKTGLFSYRVDGHPQSKYLGVIHFGHHRLLRALLSDDVPVSTLRGILDNHLAALCNTVLHQPFDEYLECSSPYSSPLTVLELRQYTSHLNAWMQHVRGVYQSNPFPAHARKSAFAVALDMMRLIQAIHENTILPDEQDPFARAGATDRHAILETLNNALLSLNQEGVLRYPMPRYPHLENLLTKPDLAVACSPDGHMIPVASVSVFEAVALEVGRSIPRSAAISPEPETLLGALIDESDDFSWGVFTGSTESVQAVIVRSAYAPSLLSVFVVRLDVDMYCYTGELEVGDLVEMADRLVFMVNRAGIKLADEVTAVSRSSGRVVS